MKAVLFLCTVLLSALCNKAPGQELPPPSGTPPQEKSPVPAPAKGAIRLTTYNVGVFTKSGSNTTDMVAAMMKELGTKVISMNELDSCTTRNPSFQIKLFAEAMDSWNYTFAPALNYQGGRYGIGIASAPDLQILKQYRIKLEKAGGSEVRALAVCEFADFVFCSTHLDHKSHDAQMVQARQITDWVASNYGTSGKPVVLCGDFNALPDSGTITYMKENWTIVSPSGFTYPASAPAKCIDYIMVYKNAADRVKLLDAQIPTTFSTGDVKVASDHLPVYVDIEILQ